MHNLHSLSQLVSQSLITSLSSIPIIATCRLYFRCECGTFDCIWSLRLQPDIKGAKEKNIKERKCLRVSGSLTMIGFPSFIRFHFGSCPYWPFKRVAGSVDLSYQTDLADKQRVVAENGYFSFQSFVKSSN